MNTVFGIICDELGHAAKEVLEPGATRPELRTRAWATPSGEVRSVQADRIPVDRSHDGIEVGEVIYLERNRGNVYCVAHVDASVSPAVRVRVGSTTTAVETPFYWSAMRSATEDFRDVLFEAVALTAFPARISARPLTFLQGALDHRQAPRRWQLEPFQRGLLERATAAHLNRRGGPLVVHDPSEVPVRVRGGYLVGDQLWAVDARPPPESVNRHALDELPGEDERPPGKLRWRPSTILSVR
jgi:hypothetical protein